MDSGKQREGFASRLGFILVSAGCAVGIGNVWRFPTVTGQNGGGVFVLFYLLFLLCMGVPVLTMELAVGRAGRKSAVGAYRALEKPGSKWHVHGWFCILGCYLLMMYYTTVSGWMLSYFVKFATGTFTGMNADQVAGVFGDMLGNPGEMGFWMAVTVVAGFFICSRGLQNGLEKITKWMMAALLLLILVLAGHSLILPGAKEGLSFYLLPNFKRASEVGLGSVIMAAMNQSFFTLSLGIAAMEIFGSYMSEEHTLAGEAVRICGLDTLCSPFRRTDYLPGMLFLWRTAGCRPAADLYHTSERVCQTWQADGSGACCSSYLCRRQASQPLSPCSKICFPAAWTTSAGTAARPV